MCCCSESFVCENQVETTQYRSADCLAALVFPLYCHLLFSMSVVAVPHQEEQEDPSDDGDLSGLDHDHGGYTHARNSAWDHEMDDDEDY